VAHRPASARRPWVAGLAAALVAALGALTGCASTVDTVNPDSYLRDSGDGWYRVSTPYANPTVPPAVVFPDSCKSPPSFSGAPAGC
jgi:hypothetical protein